MSKEEEWRKVLEEFMEIEKKMKLTKDKKSFEVLKKAAKNLVKKHKDVILGGISRGFLKSSPVGFMADIGSRLAAKSKTAQQLMEPEPLTYEHGGLVKKHKGGLIKKPKLAERGY